MRREIERRAFGDCEVRVAGDGRTLAARVVPFGRLTKPEADLAFREKFRQGAFARTIAERGPSKVKLLVGHDKHALPIGAASALTERADGLHAELRVADTPRGREVLALAAEPESPLEFSIGFVAVGDEWSRDRQIRTVTEAKLLEISAVTFGAYETEALAVRGLVDPTAEIELWENRLRLHDHFI